MGVRLLGSPSTMPTKSRRDGGAGIAAYSHWTPGEHNFCRIRTWNGLQRFAPVPIPMSHSDLSERNRVADSSAIHAGSSRIAPPISEIDILWITAGLGCDGDTIAMTAATQPSIEDIVLGALPWIPKVHFYNPFLAYENGDDFLRPFRSAAEGEGRPFILVVEGSIPNEHNKQEGYWASFGTDAKTGQPITTCEWIDRLAPRAWAVVAAGTCATYGGIHAMEGNPTGCMAGTRVKILADLEAWASDDLSSYQACYERRDNEPPGWGN